MPYTGPINPHPGKGDAAVIIYNYVPSLALGLAGVITFAIALLAHSYLFSRTRKFKLFQFVMILGSVSLGLLYVEH